MPSLTGVSKKATWRCLRTFALGSVAVIQAHAHCHAEESPVEPPLRIVASAQLATIGTGTIDVDPTVLFSENGKQVAYIADKKEACNVFKGDLLLGSFSSVLKLDFGIAGARLAVVAQQGDKRFVLVDGKKEEAFENVYGFTFNLDGMHWTYRATRGSHSCVVLDGVKGKWFDDIGVPSFGPDGRKVVYMAMKESGCLLVRKDISNAVEVEDVIDGDEINLNGPVKFQNSDGSQVAYPVMKNGKWHVATSQGYGTGYESVGSLALSRDGKQCMYVACNNGETFVVVNKTEGPHFLIGDNGHIFQPAFDTAGKRFAYLVREDSPDLAKRSMFCNHERLKMDFACGPPIFSSDGLHLAYQISDGRMSSIVDNNVVVSNWSHIIGPPVFSSDGAKVAYRVVDSEQVFVAVGRKRSKGFAMTWTPRFSTDSKHVEFGARDQDKLLWIVMESE